ncbi:MAG: DUF4185 domain-containing protein [Planctomycetota bacterium]|jgi:hypothetical protein
MVSAFHPLLCAAILPAACALPIASTSAQSFTVEEAPEWNDFFDTDSGWTGADGIFALPLDGNDRPGGLDRTSTFFVFSDTFIGDVNSAGERIGAQLVNNTAGLLKRGEFAQGAQYVWDASGANPAALVVPDTPMAQPDDWYWFSDGIVLGDEIHVLAARMRSAPGAPGFGFARAGMALITFPKDGPYTLDAITQVDAPLALPENQARGPVFFGAGIMANTAAAGAPHPDGWIYIYGSQEDPFVKKLLVARVLPQDFTDFAAWRFWDGSAWVSDIRQAAEATDRISNELSVTPTPDGRYALIFSLDTLSNKVAMKLADTPWGPFGNSIILWDIQLPSSPSVFTYNAKAHPHLSEPGELLISWNINAWDFWDHFRFADIYRPRFIKLVWQ